MTSQNVRAFDIITTLFPSFLEGNPQNHLDFGIIGDVSCAMCTIYSAMCTIYGYQPYSYIMVTPRKTNADSQKMMVSNRNLLFAGVHFRVRTVSFQERRRQSYQSGTDGTCLCCCLPQKLFLCLYVFFLAIW